MKNKLKYLLKSQVLLGSTLILLLMLLLNPFSLKEHNATYIVLVWLSVVVYSMLVIFVYKENPADEREVQHRFFSSRVAYLSGSAFLMFACIIQGTKDKIDPWIVMTLVTIVFSKLLAHIYIEHKDK